MDIKAFAALKVGDAIENGMSGSHGAVVSVEPNGVRVQWLAAGKQPKAYQTDTGSNAPTWFYGVQGTAWFHWTKLEQGTDDSAAEQAEA